jgi:hypothetical protein
MGQRRNYSDEDRANALAALDANGGNLMRTARQLGTPRKTLAEWARGRVPAAVADLRHQKRGDLADRLEAVAHELLDALPAKIKDAPLNQLAVALGILIDKLILLRRQSATPGGGALAASCHARTNWKGSRRREPPEKRAICEEP